MGYVALLTFMVGISIIIAQVRRYQACRRQVQHLEQQLEAANRKRAQAVAERTRVLANANERLLAEVEDLRTSESHQRRTQRVVEAEIEKCERLSSVEPLVNLTNRRKLDEYLESEWRRGVRDRTPIALVLLNVDCFRLFNDTYGHASGDDCLREVTEVIAAAARRPGDVAARIGGDEFVVLLGNTGTDGALSVANQIQRAIEQLAVQHETTRVVSADIVTVSIGVVSMMPEQTMSPIALLYRADEALYLAKQDGRNCVRNYQEPAANRRSSVPVRADSGFRMHENYGRQPQSQPGSLRNMSRSMS